MVHHKILVAIKAILIKQSVVKIQKTKPKSDIRPYLLAESMHISNMTNLNNTSKNMAKSTVLDLISTPKQIVTKAFVLLHSKTLNQLIKSLMNNK